MALCPCVPGVLVTISGCKSHDIFFTGDEWLRCDRIIVSVQLAWPQLVGIKIIAAEVTKLAVAVVVPPELF